MDKKIFEELNAVNVNEHTEIKDNGKTKLTYLSWSWAWAEFKKKCPNAKYEIKMFNGLPYTYDEKTGYMVFTSVTVDDTTHDMWLPVMDGNNKAMKSEPYTYTTKFGNKKVEPATMFDVNKAIMRCLTKNLAMFGLGLYIYSGEDLPEAEESTVQTVKTTTVPNEMISIEQINQIQKLGVKLDELCTYYKLKDIRDMTRTQAEQVIKLKIKKIEKQNKK